MANPPNLPWMLAHMRSKVGISQQRLAERASLDHSYISRIESGTRNPSRDTLNRMIVALGIGEDDTMRLLASAGFLPVGAGIVNTTILVDLDVLLIHPSLKKTTRSIVLAQLELIRQMLEAGIPEQELWRINLSSNTEIGERNG